MKGAERVVYRVEDLMGFMVDEPDKAITCTVCGEVVVGAVQNLAAILDACVEHRRCCREAATRR
jgi:hypothetical protein